MISSIELGNFLSHTDTKLEFDNGVTVFVGYNGSGKSSIIDAITFSLFGKHTRKSNKGLIKRGTNQGFARIIFIANGKQYQAERKIDSKGILSAQFSEKKNGRFIQIAAGERKQFGESMTSEIEKKIGLDFEKLKIASIVQQGELNSIIKAKPKEFKELLNAIIGIDKLDVASENLKLVSKSFREKIQHKIGYDDTHIDLLKKDLDKVQTRLKELIPRKEELLSKRKKFEKEIHSLRIKLEHESPKLDKINQLESRKRELQDYVKQAILEIRHEITEKERKIKDCENCFEHVNRKQNLESKLAEVDEAIYDSEKRLRDLTSQKISLQEKQELAKKLQLKDDKCPVCDSNVDKLNPLFQEEHLKQEIQLIEEKIISFEKEQEIYHKKKNDFSEKLQIAREAEATLRAHSIKSQNELIKIHQEVESKKSNLQEVPLTITKKNIVEIAQIDSHTKTIAESISKLEEETKGFDEEEFLNLKNMVEKKQSEFSLIDQELGAISGNIIEYESEIKSKKLAIEELLVVKDYVESLDSIKNNIFSRDGSVATSLRSWALSMISAKASEYLVLLNTKIQRILLSEKARDVSITCYSKNESLEIESLSGGEQVSIALALRLGMASLLGASNLNLMILDEPTTHLDSERRKALVGVLSQLSNVTNSKVPMQFIIITHDTEIFEDSTVEKIYKFDITENGSKVITI